MKTTRVIAAALGGLALAAAMLGGTRYRADMKAARQHIDNLGSQIFETACGPIEAVVTGAGDPVLVLHGNAGGFDHGLTLASGYLEQGSRIIVPSRFGYLRSPVPADATPASQADLYACLLDTLGIQKVTVVTISAGVTSAVQLAIRHPERVAALVLVSPNAPGPVDMKLPPRSLFTAIMHSDFAWWALTTCFEPATHNFVGVPSGFALTPGFQKEVTAVLTSVSPISLRGDGMVFDTYISNPSINDVSLEQVRVPTLVVSAADDPMALHANARTLAERIPGARLMVVPNGGHMLLGHTAEVKAEITRFLSEIAARADTAR